MLKIVSLSGDDLNHYIADLARLRITVFRDWPYLYDGNLEYEQRYLETYIQAQDSVVVLAFDDDDIVGASTGIPLIHETEEVKAPFIAAGYDLSTVFYFGESVLLSNYRGQGAGVAFFEHREAHAKSIGGIEYTCFCGVQRPEQHPLRPADYVPLDSFWTKRGYDKKPELNTHFSWQELGETKASLKPMTFWMKRL